jgi:hypothetical protein
MLEDRPPAIQGRDHREACRDEARHVHRGFRDADHRPARDLARGEQTRIAEAGDHIAVETLGLTFPDLVDDADGTERLVVVILDRCRSHRGARGHDLGARRGDFTRGRADGVGHGLCRVRVDHLDAHRPSPLRLTASAW